MGEPCEEDFGVEDLFNGRQRELEGYFFKGGRIKWQGEELGLEELGLE